MQNSIQQVAVIGTGTIGISWASLFLSHGLNVTATDPRAGAEDILRTEVDKILPVLQELGATAKPGQLRFTDDLVDCCDGADFVQENAVEREAEKVQLLAAVDACLRDEVVIASSSSAITVTAMQRACRRPQRVILGHPFNPPHLVPLVELVGGEQTEPWAIDLAESFYARLGKATIRLNKEIYGHVANRLQAAIFREAIYLLESGVASAGDIDKAVTEGPGLRWGIMGPFLTYHLAGGTGGISGFMAQFAPMQQRLWSELGTPLLDENLQEFVVSAVQASMAGTDIHQMAVERDRRLVASLEARSEGTKRNRS